MSKIGKKQLNISPEVFNLIKIKKFTYSPLFSPNGDINDNNPNLGVNKVSLLFPLIGENKSILCEPKDYPRRDPQNGSTVQEEKENTLIHKLVISGPLGTQSIFISNLFNIEILSNSLKITPSNNNTLILDKKTKRKRDQLWGTLWTQINKMIQGVTVGFKRYIKLTGIGYKANLIDIPNKTLVLNIGFSHPVNINVLSHINIINVSNSSQGSIIELSANTLTELNDFIFNIKKLRPAHKSFKGTGISVINPELSIT